MTTETVEGVCRNYLRSKPGDGDLEVCATVALDQRVSLANAESSVGPAHKSSGDRAGACVREGELEPAVDILRRRASRRSSGDREILGEPAEGRGFGLFELRDCLPAVAELTPRRRDHRGIADIDGGKDAVSGAVEVATEVEVGRVDRREVLVPFTVPADNWRLNVELNPITVESPAGLRTGPTVIVPASLNVPG